MGAPALDSPAAGQFANISGPPLDIYSSPHGIQVSKYSVYVSEHCHRRFFSDYPVQMLKS